MNTVGLLGKMPLHGDFVRHNVAGDAWRTLDEWVQHGLYHAQQDPAYEYSTEAWGGYAFLFTPHQGATALVGYLHPSTDTIGRQFPLIVAVEMDRGELSWDRLIELPHRFDLFLRRAHRHVVQAAHGEADRDQLVASLGSAEQNTAPYDASSPAPFCTYGDEIWAGREPAWKYLLFYNLIELIKPLEGHVPEAYTLGFRFPAPNGEERTVRHTGMWLEVLSSMLDGAQIAPTLFWRIPSGNDARASSLLAFFRPPPAKVFMDVVPVERDSDFICDMHRINDHKLDQVASSLPAELIGVLDAEESTLADVISHL